MMMKNQPFNNIRGLGIKIVISFSLILFYGSSSAISISDSLKIDSLIDRAYDLQVYDPDSAYTIAQEIYTLSLKKNYTRGIGYAAYRLGSILNRWGKNDSALLYLNQSLEIRKKSNDFVGASYTCVELNYVQQEIGEIDSAYHTLLNGLKYAISASDSHLIISLYYELGHFNVTYRDSAKALEYYQLGVKLSEQISYVEGEFLGSSGLGNFYYNYGDYDEALNYFLLADSRIRRSKDRARKAICANNIALCYEALGDPEMAMAYYTSALEENASLGAFDQIALVKFNMAVLWLNINKPDTAISLLNEALFMFQEMRDIANSARCYEFLSEAYASKHDFLDAYHAHVRFSNLNDSLLNVEKVNSIAKMRTKYDLETKESQLALLEQSNKTKTAQRNFLLAGSIVLLLSIAFLVFFFVNRFRIAKKNQALANEKIDNLLQDQEIRTNNAMIEAQEYERQRIASDLHDRLGGMLATIKLLFGSLESKLDEQKQESLQRYNKANKLIDEAVKEVRQISHNLNTGVVASFGLVMAAEELCESINKSEIVKVKMLVYGMENRLESIVAIEIYRMLQEIFNNILKHARAKNVTLQINKTENELRITVEDDGIGIDPEKKNKKMGMGLISLNNRAKKLHGTYHIDSMPYKGTISIIEIPLKADEQND
ncbi:MAG: sensor histidine kinase [Flavobacteriales bacterium]|nr:sensor histidine kinase [Flavobacteriales bacterium]